MESRLPKPSGLKRPTPVLKTILPMDRIKASGLGAFQKFGVGNGSSLVGSIAAISNFVPLSRDLSNLQSTTINPGYRQGERSGSPDLGRTRFGERVKLRRSKSASDLLEKRPLKRMEPTLAPIPSKAPRLMLTASVASSNRKQAVGFQKKTVKPPTVGAISSKVAAAGISKKPSTSSTSTSTTGAGKPINKRIPPYDFKARYNDLVEKHKTLKEKFEQAKDQMSSLENLPEQYEDSQAQLIASRNECRHAKTENECLQRQINSQNKKIESITNSLQTTTEEFEKLKEKYEKMSSEQFLLSEEVIELRERTSKLSAENTELINMLNLCKDQLFRSNMERKELHNAVLDLRGNIRVFCRVRPPLDMEEGKCLCGWNYIDECTLEIQNLELLVAKHKTACHTFSFDHVFHPRSSQEDVFELVSPLIQSAIDGYNICIFAYGQTGSGKTYTMDGIPSSVGVIPRTVDLLFDAVENYKRLGWTYEIKVTFLEIYNEVLYDLLSNEQKEMEIRMVKNSKNDIYVSNITQETVSTAAQLRQLMQIAKMNRATAATAGNERSSRSHAVTKIELIGTHTGKNEISIGSINLVDLAGSESPKTSIRMNETKNINRSLSELTNVILALIQKQDHIPYRNSKLTHLLMPSLGGNSKTLMFINVAPFQDCFVESLKSLRFAANVNSYKMAKAKKNKFLNTSTGGSFG